MLRAFLTWFHPSNLQSPLDFVAIAAALETVGTSAYSGAAPLIDNPVRGPHNAIPKTYNNLVALQDFVAAGASILATEARHSAWIQSAVKKQNPWSGAFEVRLLLSGCNCKVLMQTHFQTPLSLSQAFTLASQFITACPATNPALPVTAFPTLTVPATARPGQTVQLSFSAPYSGPLFAAFLSGLDVIWVPIAHDLTVQIPAHLFGTSYLVVTNDNTKVTDEHTVAGPALLAFPFNSRGELL